VNVLVTGGAGYVGSIVTEVLLEQGHGVVIVDNLQQGHKEALPRRAEFVSADIRDAQAMEEVFERFPIESVMHMAAETVVEYSVTDPKRHFEDNVVGGLALLDTMLKHNVGELIFSSSAAVYGEPQSVPIGEDHPQAPINAYGESKLMFERILDWYARAYGLKYMTLRYFNAAGASQSRGEDHHPETHLIPNVVKVALDKSRTVSVYGSDYPTKDGTCVRDYVHVVDIAQAHVLALSAIDRLSGKAYNLGSSRGHSVLEVVAAVSNVAGTDVPVTVCPRRPGDPAVLLASSDRAKSELGWEPEFPDIEAMVESAWRWAKAYPGGYRA
jgi:UDP-glucose 4-epimerase